MNTTNDKLLALLHVAADIAAGATRRALATMSREELMAIQMPGADDTPSTVLDCMVEEAVIDAVSPAVNILSEEIGFIDNGSAVTFVMDPVDGTVNACFGVPLYCFSGAMVLDGQFVAGLTDWIPGSLRWAATAGEQVSRSSGRTSLDGAVVNLLRAHPGETEKQWWAIAGRASRFRTTGCSTFDMAMVCAGSIDASADAGSDTHRLVDVAAALVLAPASGCVVGDAFGRPIDFDVDLTKRWSSIVAATPELLEAMQQAITEIA